MLRIKLFIFLFLIFFSQNLFAANSSQDITEIRFEGTENGKEEILYLLKTLQGKSVSQKDLQWAINTIYQFGYYSDVKIKIEESKEGGLKLISIVQERPTIKKLKISGNKYISKKRIEDELEILTGLFLTEDLRVKVKKKIIALYHNKGYHFVKVEVISPATGEKELSLTINIEEGPLVYIKGVKIEGNKLFSSRKIKKLVKELIPTRFRKKIFMEDIYQGALKMIRFLYTENGYLEVNIIPSLDFTPDRKKVTLTIDIKEGNLYRIGKVETSGNQILAEKTILKILNLKEGEIANSKKIFEGREKIKNEYSRKGYILAKVNTYFQTDEIKNRVNLLINIDEGERYSIDKIYLLGYKRTKEEVIRRKLLIKEGDVFNGEKVSQSQERLEKTDIFKSVKVYTKPNSLPDKRDLIFLMKEKGDMMCEAGAMYGNQYGGMGYGKYSYNNFLGREYKLKLDVKIGGSLQEGNISFLNPYLLNKPLALRIDISRKDSEEEYFDESRTMFGLNLTKPLKKYLTLTLGYQYIESELSNPKFPADPFWQSRMGTFSTGLVTTLLKYNSGNSWFYPTKGNLQQLLIGISSQSLGGETDFMRYFLTSEYYIKTGRKFVFVPRATFGYITPLSDGFIPVSEMFYVGGADTIRGYDKGDLSSPFGSSFMSVFNFEERFLILENLRAALFFDLGKGWNKARNFNLEDLKKTIGLELLFKSRFGLLRGGYGYRLSGEPAGYKGKFYFTIGNNF